MSTRSRFRRQLKTLASAIILIAVVASVAYTFTIYAGGLRSARSVKVAQAPVKESASWTPDPELAKQIVAEQQESREYYRRLAEGQITRFVINRVGKGKDRLVVYLTAYFAGLGKEDFRAEFVRGGPQLFLFQTTRGSPPASVADIGVDEEKLGERMLREQYEHQSFMRELVSNKVLSVVIESGDFNPESSTLTVTIHYRNGKTKSGILYMEFINGFWYLIRAEAA